MALTVPYASTTKHVTTNGIMEEKRIVKQQVKSWAHLNGEVSNQMDYHLYHGSRHIFNQVDLAKAKPYKDFGRGFYLAQDKKDAITMAIKNSPIGFVYTYAISANQLNQLSCLEFEGGYSMAWLDFITKCRNSYNSPHKYDVVIGATADGKTKEIFKNCPASFFKISKYKQSILREVSKGVFDIQYLFNTQKAIESLRLIEVEEYERESKAA